MAPSTSSSIRNIEKIVKFDGTVKNVEVSRLTAPGENYLSLVLRVDFEVQNKGHSKIISSIAKCLPQISKSEGPDFKSNSATTEITWYSKIVPILKDFAKENGITLDFYPEYHGSRYSLDSSKQEADGDSVLILENLVPQGYQNDDRYIGFDLITSKAILKNLALFNALPIVMKIKKPELFQTIKDILDKSRLKPPSPPVGSKGQDKAHGAPASRIKSHEELLFEELTKIPEFAPYLSKIKPLLEIPIMGPQSFDKLAKEPWNTIAHNDFWVNNIMINYNKKGKEPLIKIVDFQMCFYGSYAKDLVFFLLSSVRNDVTREAMDDLLRFYYNEFISIFEQTKVNLKLPYEEYLEEVRSSAAQSEILHAFTFATIIFGEKGTGIDIAVENFEPHIHMAGMLKNMNQYHKDKLVLIASEAIKRNWI